MKEIFEEIVTKTKECEANKESFYLPSIQDYEVKQTDNETEGAVLVSVSFFISDGDENITVDYESKDKCRTFQINPDRNYVTIKWVKSGKTMDSYNAVWDDKM